MMKIAMIGHKRMPSREGGVEIVVEELSTRLVKKGHKVDVYNRKGKNVQDKKIDKETEINSRQEKQIAALEEATKEMVEIKRDIKELLRRVR